MGGIKDNYDVITFVNAVIIDHYDLIQPVPQFNTNSGLYESMLNTLYSIVDQFIEQYKSRFDVMDFKHILTTTVIVYIKMVRDLTHNSYQDSFNNLIMQKVSQYVYIEISDRVLKYSINDSQEIIDVIQAIWKNREQKLYENSSSKHFENDEFIYCMTSKDKVNINYNYKALADKLAYYHADNICDIYTEEQKIFIKDLIQEFCILAGKAMTNQNELMAIEVFYTPANIEFMLKTLAKYTYDYGIKLIRSQIPRQHQDFILRTIAASIWEAITIQITNQTHQNIQNDNSLEDDNILQEKVKTEFYYSLKILLDEHSITLNHLKDIMEPEEILKVEQIDAKVSIFDIVNSLDKHFNIYNSNLPACHTQLNSYIDENIEKLKEKAIQELLLSQKYLYDSYFESFLALIKTAVSTIGNVLIKNTNCKSWNDELLNLIIMSLYNRYAIYICYEPDHRKVYLEIQKNISTHIEQIMLEAECKNIINLEERQLCLQSIKNIT
jgi:hypothetical protein